MRAARIAGWRRSRKESWRKISHRIGKEIQRIVSNLPLVDLASVREPCVIMQVETLQYQHPRLFAWFPKGHYVAEVSYHNLLPMEEYVHLASCSGFLCGMHYDTVAHELLEDEYPDEWTLKLAVCNPATGFRMELPALQVCCPGERNAPGMTLMMGMLEVKMTPPMHGDAGDRNRFSVHVVRKVRVCTIYTFNSGSQAWESHANDPEALTDHLASDFVCLRRRIHGYDVNTRSWTAIPSGVQDWDDFPLPREFEGCSYRSCDAFLYKSRVMVAGQCNTAGFDKAGIVLLELKQDGSGWEIVTSVSTADFKLKSAKLLAYPEYEFRQPLCNGDILVFSASADRLKPVAFHLETNTWLHIPTSLWLVPLNSNCIYDPPSS